MAEKPLYIKLLTSYFLLPRSGTSGAFHKFSVVGFSQKMCPRGYIQRLYIASVEKQNRQN